MKRLLLTLLCVLPLLAAAQNAPVPADLYFAGLHLRLTDGGRKAVQQKADALRSHAASFQARVALADAHFPLIDRTFQTEGLPQDFRYLVLQESGLQGDAQSIHDAVGYWQFKRESATELGVLVNDAVDERKHLVVASRAAAKYFLRNNATFHNWLNALLSYNLGLTGAKPYTLPTDYNATEMEISEQTHPYIITFLAHKVAFEPACGQNPKPAMLLQEFPALAGQQLPALAASLQTDPAALARHNRWLLPNTAVPTDKPYTLLVPITDPLQLTAMAALQKATAGGQLLHEPTVDPQNAEFVQINGLRALIALPGDTKESLAQRAGLKMRKFMQYNDLFAFDNIVAGQPYYLQKKRDKAAVEYHIAQAGESVATISQKYGVRAKAIWAKNRMPRNEELRTGRILWLQHTRPREVAIEYAPSENAGAVAAFERPATAPAATEEPARKKVKVKVKDEAEPYTGRTAAASRAIEDDAAETASATVTQADSATDDHMDNLNELPAAAKTQGPAVVRPTAPAPTQASSVPSASAGQPVKKALPASSPIADEPAEEDEPTATAVPAKPTAPVAKPEPVRKETPVAAAIREPVPAPKEVTKPAAAAQSAPAAAPVPRPLPPTFPAQTTAAAVEPVPASGIHIVQKSESLYAIARRYGLRPADVILWNSLPANPSLRLGQSLRVVPPTATGTTPAASAQPVPSDAPETAPAAAAALAPVRHKVAVGESMYGISRKYGVTIKQIMEWNNKADFNVKPGEVLLIKPAK
ncbi:membrane-bound lytic murein transglycosylase D [Hymenobacter daecheongensis DSM 21074]|uniref:Membrane-bound lytic murein transglycosylase D n=1 Tax=Hymenobacter daecheongensis DSM 21074 TaxID=1121955 RepID=A0A1M6CNP6_9BACT|nr:LysM peptidoglycan-binding domain-containing protein [Hymenobacter daecheongensis]SHI62627.1 membrane-bound lytic murein transglycosylase D [Hymenobacter daecheongensis DSM 21074]